MCQTIVYIAHNLTILVYDTANHNSSEKGTKCSQLNLKTGVTDIRVFTHNVAALFWISLHCHLANSLHCTSSFLHVDASTPLAIVFPHHQSVT